MQTLVRHLEVEHDVERPVELLEQVVERLGLGCVRGKPSTNPGLRRPPRAALG